MDVSIWTRSMQMVIRSTRSVENTPMSFFRTKKKASKHFFCFFQHYSPIFSIKLKE